MSEQMLIQHCSPTLAGIKTGNLFSCAYDDAEEIKQCVRGLNKKLAKKGVRILPLRYKAKRALIYVYRPSLLGRDLCSNFACDILYRMGYSCQSPEICIVELIRRLRYCDDFPHEIGLFLGYPPEDVNGFIENKADNFKCVGCWKVYGDEQNALSLFEKYRKCTDAYCKQWAKGESIERLTAAV